MNKTYFWERSRDRAKQKKEESYGGTGNSIDADINGGASPVLTITATTIEVDKQ